MPTPVYNGGGFGHGGGHGHPWGPPPGPTDNGWFDSVGSWFGGNTPPYAGAGQPASGTGGNGTPVYLPPPMMGTAAGAATTAPQAVSPVLGVPRVF
jgi:hypothetical protein